MKIHKLMILILVILSSVIIQSTEYSGIKFGIDTQIIQKLSKMDLNKLTKNRILFSKKVLESQIFPSYRLDLENVSIQNIKNPSNVIVSTKVDGGNNYLNMVFENLEIDLQLNFDLNVINILKEHGEKTPIMLIINKFELELFFINNQVKIQKLDVKLGDIDLKFQKWYFKLIYFLGKPCISKAVNSSMEFVRQLLETEFNNLISNQQLINVGMGIGFNATVLNSPQLEIFDKLIEKEVKYENNGFLGLKFVEEIAATSILEFGINGAVYPNLSEYQPTSNSIDMQYLSYTFNNLVSILLSDYTVNSLLYMVQQSSYLTKELKNDTNTFVPITIDTVGLSSIIPQFAEKYSDNKLAAVKVYVDPLKNKQPLFSSFDEGAQVSINFRIDFNIFTSDDPFDDPVNDLRVDVTANFKLQFVISQEKLNVIVLKSTIDSVEKIVDQINVPEKNDIKEKLEKVLVDTVKLNKQAIMGVDVCGKLSESTGLKFSKLIFDTSDKYIAIAIDVASE